MTPGIGQRVIETTRRLTDRYNRLELNGDQVLVATGTQRFITQVGEFVRAQNATAGETLPLEYRVFYLRYAWADDTTLTMGNREMRVPGVATLLRRIIGGEEESLEVVQPAERPGASQRRDGLRRGGAEAAGEEGDARAQAIASPMPGVDPQDPTQHGGIDLSVLFTDSLEGAE